MVRRVFTLGAGIVGLILAMVLVMGLATPAFAHTAVPTVSDNAPAGWSNSDVTVTITADDSGGPGITKIQYRVNSPADPTWHNLARIDTAHAEFTVTAPTDHSNDGAHAYRYRAIDAAGNVSTTGVCTVNIDTTGPKITANAPSGWKKTAVTVTLKATDSLSGVAKRQYRLASSGTWLDTTANQFVVDAPADHSADGANNYQYRALDSAGNVSATGACTVNIDTTTPAVSDNAPAGWNATAVVVTINAVDSGSGVGKIQYRLSGPATPTWIDATMIDVTHGQFVVPAPANHSGDGANVYRYRAIDNLGNVSATGICTVRISTW